MEPILHTSSNLFDNYNSMEEKQDMGTLRTACTLSTGNKVAAYDEEDNTTIRSYDTNTISDSPALAPEAVWMSPFQGTPSTVETTGSLDDGSINGEKHHQRVLSWDGIPFDSSFSGGGLPPCIAANVWGDNKPVVASFRDQEEITLTGKNENRWLQPLRLAHHKTSNISNINNIGSNHTVPFLPAPGGTTYHRVTHPPLNNFANSPHRKTYAQPPLHPSVAPRTTLRSPTHAAPYTAGGRGSPMSSQARSSSEVLKTLLRKKACLYEPDTSRAVALVTWLVGRELALEYGFFSRQQLQAGVHCCVADKIDEGVITRTKVNRCMQIILNSCFHYIIPRPDGTDENGAIFKGLFAREMRDDRALLQFLPRPWNNVCVSHNNIIESSRDELEKKGIKKPPNVGSTPPSSPKVSIQPPPDDDMSDGKRAVLLCFNENVRSARDVFRCHNEFIRDTAHASNLQLSADEWQHFFGCEAANSRHIWGNVGIPVPCNEQYYGYKDALGMLVHTELCKLRTFWCAKRYEHNPDLCAFAHVEINDGWLRRNPLKHKYEDKLCPWIKIVDLNDNRITINECPYGVTCEFAHSNEEIAYHPLRYKSRACAHVRSPGGCPYSDMCADFHPVDTYRFPRRTDGRHGMSKTHSKPSNHDSILPQSLVPNGSPTLYVNPAPLSSFEQHMFVPGLQQQYRRHCSVARAHLLSNNSKCYYSYFGGDAEGTTDRSTIQQRDARIIHCARHTPCR